MSAPPPDLPPAKPVPIPPAVPQAQLDSLVDQINAIANVDEDAKKKTAEKLAKQKKLEAQKKADAKRKEEERKKAESMRIAAELAKGLPTVNAQTINQLVQEKSGNNQKHPSPTPTAHNGHSQKGVNHQQVAPKQPQNIPKKPLNPVPAKPQPLPHSQMVPSNAVPREPAFQPYDDSELYYDQQPYGIDNSQYQYQQPYGINNGQYQNQAARQAAVAPAMNSQWPAQPRYPMNTSPQVYPQAPQMMAARQNYPASLVGYTAGQQQMQPHYGMYNQWQQPQTPWNQGMQQQLYANQLGYQ